MKGEMTAQEIAQINFDTAIDQAGDYDSVLEAIDAYHDNALDTAREQGVSFDDVNGLYADRIKAWEFNQK